MAVKRATSVKRAQKNGRVRKRRRPITLTRAEFDAVVKRLNQCNQVIKTLRRELHETCRQLGEQARSELQIQFTRIAQLQQEVDALKRGI